MNIYDTFKYFFFHIRSTFLTPVMNIFEICYEHFWQMLLTFLTHILIIFDTFYEHFWHKFCSTFLPMTCPSPSNLFPWIAHSLFLIGSTFKLREILDRKRQVQTRLCLPRKVTPYWRYYDEDSKAMLVVIWLEKICYDIYFLLTWWGVQMYTKKMSIFSNKNVYILPSIYI